MADKKKFEKPQIEVIHIETVGMLASSTCTWFETCSEVSCHIDSGDCPLDWWCSGVCGENAG